MAHAAQEPPLHPLLDVGPRFERIPLSASTIFRILQDRRGFLWVGTEIGLFRYDGVEWIHFRHDPTDAGTLISNTVTSLVEDRDGILWVGAYGGLMRYNPRTERFTRFEHTPNSQDGPAASLLNALTLDSKGRIWLALTGNTVDRFDPVSARFVHFPIAPAGERVEGNAVIVDHQGVVWSASSAGVRHCDQETGRCRPLEGRGPDASRVASQGASALFEDAAHDVWIGSRNGLSVWRRATGVVERFQRDPTGRAALATANIFGIAGTPDGKVWIATSSGLHVVDPGTSRLERHAHNPADPESLSGNAVNAVAVGRDGAVWAGTTGAGLNRYDPRGRPFVQVRSVPGDANNLGPGRVAAIAEDHEGTLWCGREGYGLSRLDAGARRFVHYRHDPADPKSLGDDTVRAILADRRGRLWLGTNGGLDRFDRDTGRFIHYRHDPARPDSIPTGNVLLLFEDRAGSLWVGFQPSALGRFDPETGQFQEFRVTTSPGALPSSVSVPAMDQDPEGRLWMGSLDQGLIRFDPATGEVTRYARDPRVPGGIRNDAVWSVYCHDGALWIGTPAGLDLFEPKTGQFTHFGRAQGTPDDMVRTLIRDATGRLWLAAASALALFDPVSRTFRAYGPDSGLPVTAFSHSTAVLSRGGPLIFGGPQGLTVFDPASLVANRDVPPVVLTGLRVRNEAQAPGAKGSPLAAALDFTEALTLSAAQSAFSIEFAAVTYWFPARTRYAYKLEPFHTDWIEVDGTRRFAAYAPPPGDYVFSVKAANSDGVWSQQPRTLHLRLLPPWWRTAPAYAVWLLGAVVLVIGAVRWRTQVHVREIERQRRVNENLQRLNDERTLAIEQLQRADAARLRAMQRLERLRDMDLEVAQAASPEHMARIGLTHLRGMVACERLAVVTFDVQSGGSSCLANDVDSVGASSEAPGAWAAEHLPAWQGREQGKPLVLPDLGAVAEPTAFERVLRAEELRSLAAVPMLVEGRLVGAVIVASHRVAAFSAEHVDIVEEIATTLAISIEQARMRTEIERHSRDLQRRIEERTAELRAANQELEAFAYSVSHDLRAPLRHISSFVGLLRRGDAGLDLARQRYLGIIEASARRMDQLIDDLLSFSRTSLSELRTLPVDLGGVVSQVRRELAHSQDGRSVKWTVGALPVVAGDPGLLRQVFINLLSNALKYTGPREVACIDIGVAAADDGRRQVTVFVRDNGVGFNPEYAHRLFGVFQRLHRDDEFPGTGIGLATVRRIVERHGGSIRAEAIEGQGATFYVTLRTPGQA